VPATSPISERDGDTILTIHVQPGASRTEYAGLHGGALKFRIAAPPVDGAANDELCRALADTFGLPRRAVTVQSGTMARRKRVQLKCCSAARVRQVFGLPQ
jgi:uncharacterized protein (TIGR00251 family)